MHHDIAHRTNSRERQALRHAAVACPQVLQWAFAGAPGHPALREVCDRIATAALTAGAGAPGGALERTGMSAWTEVVLKHARLHPPAQVPPLDGADLVAQRAACECTAY